MMFGGLRTVAVIPALDEEESIGEVVAAVDRAVVDEIVVVDNGSRDRTAARAAAAGATVVREARRGYGSACMAGISAAGGADVLVFLDGDGSDDPAEIPRLLEALRDAGADAVIGSRTMGLAEPGALTPTQRLGNALTCGLVRALWGRRYTDLGPFRAIRKEALERLRMSDAGFGWTVEMQVKAARQGLEVLEVPVSRRRRRKGRSKISGTIRGTLLAGAGILGYVARSKIDDIRRGRIRPGPAPRIVVLTRSPEPGGAKTRLIPALGAERAALLHRRMTERTLEVARRAAGRLGADLEVRFDGDDPAPFSAWLGDVPLRAQGGGDLGDRVRRAFEDAFREGAAAAVVVGSDCPDMEERHVLAAFDALGRRDAVFGPAEDGGYYLVGLTGPVPGLFEGIPWSTDRVLADSVRAVEAAGRSAAQLERLVDIDRPEDLARLPEGFL